MKTMRYLLIPALLLSLPLAAQQQEVATPEPSPLFTHPTFIVLLATALVLMGVIISLTSAIRNLSENGRQKLRKERNGGGMGAAVTLFLMLGSLALHAETTTETGYVTDKFMPPSQLGGIDSWVFVILAVTIVVQFIIILSMLKAIKNLLVGLGYQPELAEAEVKPLLNWKWLDRKLTDAVPLEKEADIMTDHEYDGIKELDNNLPPWWVYGFYFTIIFSVYYIFDYHILRTSPLQAQEYNNQMAEAEAAKQQRLKTNAANVDENSVTLLTDAGALGSGKEIYTGNCASCHGANGEGLVGPNLTDEYWLHGGGVKNVFKTIKYGVPAKGMIAWQAQLSPEAMQKVSSYVLSLQGSKPANGKAPQGAVWVEEGSAPADSTAAAPDTAAAQASAAAPAAATAK